MAWIVEHHYELLEIMAQIMKRPRLKAINLLNDFKIVATFIDDSIFTIDFKPFFDGSPGLAPLKKPSVFAGAIVDKWGCTLEWPELDIQISADTLWLDAQAQNAPDENTRIFAQWRARHGLSLADAARALGMTPRTMTAYGSGKRPVPLVISRWLVKAGKQNSYNANFISLTNEVYRIIAGNPSVKPNLYGDGLTSAKIR